MSKEEQAFRKQHSVNLKGKEYLPVAARIVLFRRDNPNHGVNTIITNLSIGEEKVPHVCATVFDPEGRAIAQAHKRIRSGGRGASAEWPVETAETGAIGRALGLLGYGTLGGDFDEGDQLADAPVNRKATIAEAFKKENK